MRMRILMAVPHTLPSPEGGHGCPVMSWAMLKWLKDTGHEVSLFAFSPTTSTREPGRVQARGHLKALGVPLVETEPNHAKRETRWELRLLTARKMIAPKLSDYLADSIFYRPQWEKTVEKLQPDAFWLYTTEAVALSHNTFQNIPRLASLIDLDHEAHALKRILRPNTLRNKLRNLAEELQDRLLPETTVEYLKCCDIVIEHSISSAQWLNDHGIPAHYLPNPIDADPLPSDWFAQRERLLANTAHKRILMVGHLRGIATQTGLHLLADKVLPALASDLKPSEWEIHIVGGGELTAALEAKLALHPKVRLRGFVKGLLKEYQESHLSLVAVSEKIGFRTRLVEAFAYASPSVVHSNNRYGMPELENEYNCLLADTGQGLADAIIRVLTDDLLRRRLEANARRTYEESLSAPIVMNRMYELLEAQVS